MASSINPNNIDGAYPVAGQDNNSQGFRDNFTNIKQNFQFAEDEINDLQTKAVLKSALVGGTLDNNLNDNLVYRLRIQDVGATKVTKGTIATSVTFAYEDGHYQTMSSGGAFTIAFTGWPDAGVYGLIKIQVTINNVAHTMTLPSAVTLGKTGIQGLSGNTITFDSTGTYEFAFSTSDSGTNITIFDLNRGLVDFGGGALTVTDLNASGIVSATGNITGGNVNTGSQMSATGNITGGNLVTTGLVVSTGNITGGNVLSPGLISATGNLQGVNVLGLIRPTSGSGSTTGVPLQFTAGTNVAGNNVSAGSFEYDGTAFYGAPVASQRGLLPAAHIRRASSSLTLADVGGVEPVFASPANINLAASTTYEFEAVYFIVRSAGGTSRTLALLFGVDSALTNISYIAQTTSSAGVALAACNAIRASGVGSVTVTAASTDTNQNILVKINGVLTTNAAVQVTPQLQFSASVGGTVAVATNSYIKFTPLGNAAFASVGDWV